MLLDEYITKLQTILEKFGNIRVMKNDHPYPDDWDDNDFIIDPTGPDIVEIETGQFSSDNFITEHDPSRFGRNRNKYRNREVVIIIS